MKFEIGLKTTVSRFLNRLLRLDEGTGHQKSAKS